MYLISCFSILNKFIYKPNIIYFCTLENKIFFKIINHNEIILFQFLYNNCKSTVYYWKYKALLSDYFLTLVLANFHINVILRFIKIFIKKKTCSSIITRKIHNSITIQAGLMKINIQVFSYLLNNFT